MLKAKYTNTHITEKAQADIYKTTKTQSRLHISEVYSGFSKYINTNTKVFTFAFPVYFIL